MKRYEEELERRKNKNWLPLEDVLYSAKYESVDVLHVEMKMETTFNNYCCFYKYRDYLEAINKSLVANAKGEPIDIEVLLPLLPKGWVAMDENKRWYWYNHIPTKVTSVWENAEVEVSFCLSNMFDLKPAENWEDSLMECGL